MRVLIIRNYPTTLDLVTRRYNIQEIGLACALRRRGHVCDVVFFCAGRGYVAHVPCENGPVAVHHIRALRVLKCGVFPRALDELARDYDVVQLGEYNQIQSFLYAGRFPEKTVILHGPYSAPCTPRYRAMCRLADALFLGRYRRLGTPFLAKSARAERFLQDRGIAHVRRVYVGLDEGAFAARPQRAMPAALDEALGGAQPVLLYVGAVERRRRSLFLLDVFCAVRARVPDVRLVVVGGGKGVYGRRFAGRIRALGIGGCVTWIDSLEQAHMPRLYERASAFLFPTAFDIFGMVLLEAMYFGVPVLSSPCGGADTLIRDGENGFMLRETSIRSWAARTVELLDSPALCARIGGAARAQVRGTFTWDAVCGRYLRAYREAILRAQEVAPCAERQEKTQDKDGR